MARRKKQAEPLPTIWRVDDALWSPRRLTAPAACAAAPPGRSARCRHANDRHECPEGGTPWLCPPLAAARCCGSRPTDADADVETVAVQGSYSDVAVAQLAT